MARVTQIQRILTYCAEHGSITNREAVVKLNINSPTKRISELRSSGDYDVQVVEEQRVKDDGEVVRFNRYFIKKLEGVVS